MARILSAFHWLCHLELVAGKCLQHHLSAAFTNILAPFPLVSGCKFQSLFSPHLLLKALRVAGKSHSLQFPLTPRYYSLIFLLTSFGLQSSLYTAYLHTLFSFFLLLPPLSSFSSSSSLPLLFLLPSLNPPNLVSGEGITVEKHWFWRLTWLLWGLGASYLICLSCFLPVRGGWAPPSRVTLRTQLSHAEECAWHMVALNSISPLVFTFPEWPCKTPHSVLPHPEGEARMWTCWSQKSITGAPMIFIRTGLARTSLLGLVVSGWWVMPVDGKQQLKSSRPLPSCSALTLLVHYSWSKRCRSSTHCWCPPITSQHSPPPRTHWTAPGSQHLPLCLRLFLATSPPHLCT